MKQWIDNATYEQLLQKWRFAPSGDSFFVGEVGSYYTEVLSKKRNGLSHAEQVSISKRVEW